MCEGKNIKKLFFILAIVSAVFFSITITASASEESVNGLKQTNSSTSTVTLQWDKNVGQSYKVLYSKNKTSGYIADNNYTTSLSNWIISGLEAGTTYYVKIASYVSSNYDDVYVDTSEPIQVVTTPDDVESNTIKQIEDNSNRVIIKWNKVTGATGYRVELDSKYGKITRVVTGTMVSIPVLSGNRYTVLIKSYKKSSEGYSAISKYGVFRYIYSIPRNAQNLADYNKENLEWDTNNNITIRWTRNSYYNSNDSATPTGYQIQICELDGNTILYTGTTISNQITITSLKVRQAIKNKGFKVRIRAYVKINDEKLIWSGWSPFKVVIPQAYIYTNNLKVVNKNGVKFTWSGVANAQYYYVYYSKNVSSSNNITFLKKKVNSSTRSFTITGLDYYQRFGFFVVPVVRVNGKLYSGIKKYYYYNTIKYIN